MLDNSQLKKILPRAYPFVLLDRVGQYCPGKSLVAIKNITANEWPFSQSTYKLEHYPETLLIEATAQAALVLYRVNHRQACLYWQGEGGFFFANYYRRSAVNSCQNLANC